MSTSKVLFVFKIMSFTSKSQICREYGKNFYTRFLSASRRHLNTILPEVPDIGDSIFGLNYNYGPCYFSWYAALHELGIDQTTALNQIWQINEDFVKAFPKPLLHWFAKNMYLGVFRKKATLAEERGKNGQLHPFDWRIEYQSIDKNTFAINIYECAMLKLADRFGYQELFPHVCRMDYLFSHYFDNAFQRTKTLADGDDCCNCWYQFPGKCEWSPEKGFANRK